MYSMEEIFLFIEKHTGSALKEINSDTDIFNDLRVSGDDFDEMK